MPGQAFWIALRDKVAKEANRDKARAEKAAAEERKKKRRMQLAYALLCLVPGAAVVLGIIAAWVNRLRCVSRLSRWSGRWSVAWVPSSIFCASGNGKRT